METLGIIAGALNTFGNCRTFSQFTAFFLATKAASVRLVQAQDEEGTGIKIIPGAILRLEEAGYGRITVSPAELDLANHYNNIAMVSVGDVQKKAINFALLLGEDSTSRPGPSNIPITESFRGIELLPEGPEQLSNPDALFSAFVEVYIEPSENPPTAPDTLRASLYHRNRVRLTWSQEEIPVVDGTSIERQTGQEAWTEIAQVEAGILEYRDSGLEYERLYRYRIRAFNEFGYSEYSNLVQRTTGSEPD